MALFLGPFCGMLARLGPARARAFRARRDARRLLARHGGVHGLLEEISCPVCGPDVGADPAYRVRNRTRKFLPVALDFVYRRCQGCGLVYLSPRLRANVLRELYERAYVPSAGLSVAQIEKKARDVERYASHLRATAPPHTFPRLLDVGCGHGQFLIAAAHAGYDVRGQEFADLGAFWKAHAPALLERIVAAPLEDSAAFPDGAFDLVTMWEVAEHIQEPRITFGAVARTLRPGGRLVIESPRADTVVLSLLGERWSQLIPEEHLFLWTEHSLPRLLEEIGLRVLEIRDSVSPRDAFVGRIHLAAERVR